ncbi:hypothetical protein, partial [Alitiscatomonas aceti]
FIRIFRVLHTVQFSRFCAVLVFLSDSLASLSQLFLFVKSFFKLFSKFLSAFSILELQAQKEGFEPSRRY